MESASTLSRIRSRSVGSMVRFDTAVTASMQKAQSEKGTSFTLPSRTIPRYGQRQEQGSPPQMLSPALLASFKSMSIQSSSSNVKPSCFSKQLPSASASFKKFDQLSAPQDTTVPTRPQRKKKTKRRVPRPPPLDPCSLPQSSPLTSTKPQTHSSISSSQYSQHTSSLMLESPCLASTAIDTSPCPVRKHETDLSLSSTNEWAAALPDDTDSGHDNPGYVNICRVRERSKSSASSYRPPQRTASRKKPPIPEPYSKGSKGMRRQVILEEHDTTQPMLSRSFESLLSESPKKLVAESPYMSLIPQNDSSNYASLLSLTREGKYDLPLVHQAPQHKASVKGKHAEVRSKQKESHYGSIRGVVSKTKKLFGKKKRPKLTPGFHPFQLLISETHEYEDLDKWIGDLENSASIMASPPPLPPR